MTDIINLYNLLQSATVEERVTAAKAVMSENAPTENDFIDDQNDVVTPEQVEGLISQIAPVTLESETAINNAQAAFNSTPKRYRQSIREIQKFTSLLMRFYFFKRSCTHGWRSIQHCIIRLQRS